MPKVLVQAGHSAAFVPFQAGGGGAPGEAAWVTDLAKRLAARLTAAGVVVALVGCWNLDNSNAPPIVTEQDYALFLALHYDAAVYGPGKNTGCFADRAAADPMGTESTRFITLWEPVYTEATGLPLRNERRNANTWDYYAFRATTAQTPGVLIEHGVGMGDDHATLFNRIDAVADADAAAVLAFLNVGTVPIVAPPQETPDMTDEQRRILAALAERDLTTEQKIRDLYTWSDETVKQRNDLAAEVDSVRKELDTVKDQLAQVPAQGPPPTVTSAALAVRVELSDGRAVVVPVGKGVPTDASW